MDALDLRRKYDRFFTYNPTKLANRINLFNETFSKVFNSFSLAYSVKTNYAPCVMRDVIKHNVIPEVVSEFELDIVRSLGFMGHHILNGPIKTESAIIESARTNSTINIDSLDDWKIVKRVANGLSKNMKLKVAIRLNHDDYAFGSSRFGVDVKSHEFSDIITELKKITNIEFAGIHLHLPDRNLESFRARAEVLRTIVIDLHGIFGSAAYNVNLGGGFRSTMPKKLHHENVDLEDYALQIEQGFGEDLCRCINLTLEPGTSLIAESFDYWAKVVAIKSTKHGRDIFVNGSIFDYAAKSRSRMYDFSIISDNHSTEIAATSRFVGYTCIEDDVLLESEKVSIGVGDFLRIQSVGSYSIVMRPNFIFPSPPIFREESGGSYTMTRKEQTAKNMLVDWIH